MNMFLLKLTHTILKDPIKLSFGNLIFHCFLLFATHCNSKLFRSRGYRKTTLTRVEGDYKGQGDWVSAAEIKKIEKL